jgi:predicted RecA/RadA family phage recombinase
MKNFIQDGATIQVTAPTGGVSSGDGVLVNNLFGVAATDADEGAAVNIATVGVFSLPKTTASFSSGGAVSWNVSVNKAEAPGSGHYPIGVATAAAGTGATTVNVRLDGTSTAAA